MILAPPSKTRFSARTMFRDLAVRSVQDGIFGGMAYIHMRTPMFSLSVDKDTGKTKISRKMVLRHRTDLSPAFLPDGKPDNYKSGEKKGQQKFVGRLNPYWDHTEGVDRPKIIKNTIMRVHLMFDWQKICRRMQECAGIEPDFVPGQGKPTWRRDPVVWIDENTHEKMRTPFVYKVDLDANGEPIQTPVEKTKIYLYALTPIKLPGEEFDPTKLPKIEANVWYEELAPKDEQDAQFFLPSDVEDWLTEKGDAEQAAASQGHAGRVDLNRSPFTVDIRNIVSLSAAGQKYRMPRRNWDTDGDLSPVSFEEVEVDAEPDIDNPLQYKIPGHRGVFSAPPKTTTT
jgi:hypothetical protein